MFMCNIYSLIFFFFDLVWTPDTAGACVCLTSWPSGLAGCQFSGLLRYIGHGTSVSTDDRKTPANKMYKVWEKDWLAYPHTKPTTANKQMMYWKNLSALSWPSKSMCVGKFLMKAGTSGSMKSMVFICRHLSD